MPFRSITKTCTKTITTTKTTTVTTTEASREPFNWARVQGALGVVISILRILPWLFQHLNKSNGA